MNTTFFTKTNWTLIAAVVIALGNALIPFMSATAAGEITTVLGIVAMLFHVNDVQNAKAAAFQAGSASASANVKQA